jgi:hypothetical protein
MFNKYGRNFKKDYYMPEIEVLTRSLIFKTQKDETKERFLRNLEGTIAVFF